MKSEFRVLKQLGTIPLWRGEKRFMAEIERCYRKAAEAASRRLVKGK